MARGLAIALFAALVQGSSAAYAEAALASGGVEVVDQVAPAGTCGGALSGHPVSAAPRTGPTAGAACPRATPTSAARAPRPTPAASPTQPAAASHPVDSVTASHPVDSVAASHPVDSVEVAGVITGPDTTAAVAPLPAQLPNTGDAARAGPAGLLLVLGLLGTSAFGAGLLLRRRGSPA